MTHNHSRRNGSLLLAAFTLACGTAAAQSYQLTDLGTLDGLTSVASAVNNADAAVGASTRADASIDGFLWDGAQTAIDPLAGDDQCHAVDINDAGAVAALSYDLGAVVTHGLLWQNGTVTDLGAIAPRGLSPNGIVVGHLATSTAALPLIEHAARWQNGVITDLGTLGGNFSYAAAVNSAGQIVGWSYLADNLTIHATLWQNGAPLDLGTLGGTTSEAYDLSDNGHAAGFAMTAAGEAHPCRFEISPAGTVLARIDLGTLGGTHGVAYGVNSLGDVVGSSNNRAFLWHAGVLVDLNATLPAGSPWHLDGASSINDNGTIVGTGTRLGFPHAYMLRLGVPGDCDGDGDVDPADAVCFVACLAGPDTAPLANCGTFDFDVDGDVDLLDFGAMQYLVAAP